MTSIITSGDWSRLKSELPLGPLPTQKGGPRWARLSKLTDSVKPLNYALMLPVSTLKPGPMVELSEMRWT